MGTRSSRCVLGTPSRLEPQRHATCNTSQVWDSRSGQLVRVQQGHKGMVTSLFFSATVRLLFSGSIDSTVGIWTDKGVNLQVHGPRAGAHAARTLRMLHACMQHAVGLGVAGLTPSP